MKQHRLTFAITLLALLAAAAYFAFGGGEKAPRGASLDAVEADREPTTDASLEITRAGEQSVPAPVAPQVAVTPAAGALRMRALDAAGKPLPRARIAAYERTTWIRWRKDGRELWRGEADDQGRAEWSGAGAELARLKGTDAIALFLDGFVPYAEHASVEKEEQLADVFELRAPPFGRVVLRVWTPLERPVERGNAHLIAWSGRGLVSNDPAERDPYRQARIENGVARFDYVALGTPLRAIGSIESGPETTADIAPLNTAGEVREVDLRIGSDALVLRLRILGEDGRLFPSAREFRMQMGNDQGGFSWSSECTDSESVLWLDTHERTAETGDLVISIQTRDEGAAEVRVPLIRERGMIDLGDVILRRGPLLIAGRILLPDGAPAEHAQIQARLTPWKDAQRAQPSVDHVKSDEQGRFAWHHPDGAGLHDFQVLLLAKLPLGGDHELRVRPRRFALGTTDVELRLEELGMLEARWSSRLAWDPRSISASLVAIEPEIDPNLHTQGSVSEDGIRFPKQLAGRYELRVKQSGSPYARLLSIPDLVVIAGQSCEDPRLRAIELEPHCTALHFELGNAIGLERLEGELRVREIGAADAPWQRHEFRGERVHVVLPRGRYDAIVRVEGAREERFEALSEGRKIELRAALRIELQIEGTFELPADGSELRLHLRNAEGVVSSTPFDAQGRARALLARPGRYRIGWLAEPAFLDVADTAAEQRFIVPPPKQD